LVISLTISFVYCHLHVTKKSAHGKKQTHKKLCKTLDSNYNKMPPTQELPSTKLSTQKLLYTEWYKSKLKLLANLQGWCT